ncbi:MAG: MarR family transcriptional regulator [Peptococcaceae bacterium]|nr:MarR family transcriptional regulator [Peptococcaceae bacterium]
MDYTELAEKYLHEMTELRKARFQKNLTNSLRGESLILQYMAQHDGIVIPGAISSEMNISSARITAALNSMENKGLVTREIDRSDRRRILTKLTQEGKDLAVSHKQNCLNDIIGMLQLLDYDDAREYVRLIGVLVNKLQLSQMTTDNN